MYIMGSTVAAGTTYERPLIYFDDQFFTALVKVKL